MSTNAQMLDDLRYCVDNFVSHHDEVEANLREFAASLIGSGISPPAQKPASVPGGSGAGLVGNPATPSSKDRKQVGTEKPKKSKTPSVHFDSVTVLASQDSAQTFPLTHLPVAALAFPVVDTCGSCSLPESNGHGHESTPSVPVTLSGDAWESAAHHVIAIREKRQSNRDTWRQIGQFLDSMPKAES